MNIYEGLTKHLNFIAKRFKVQITIKDYIGLLESDENLFLALEDFYIHKAAYCMYIKGNERLWGYCLKSKELIHKKLLNNPKSYLGTCYAGITEYVVPILSNKVVIGSIHVGQFSLSEDERQVYLSKMSKRQQMNLDQLKKFYKESTRSTSLYLSLIESELQIVIEYIRLIYQQLEFKVKARSGHTTEFDRPYILSHAMEYIRQNYRYQIYLEDVARFCHCSKSYLSHQFKRHTGLTMNSYINLLRIKDAKILLQQGNKNLTELAYELGFKDSNYFSKVFKDFEKKSPSSYRKELQG